jgi:hypothetical protein
MTAKERAQAAIARQPIDRVPVGLYAVDHDTVEAVIGRPTVVRNQLAMQLALWEGRRNEMVEQWKADLTDFYRKIDCVDIITCRDAMLMPPHDGLVSPLMPPPWPEPGEPPRKTSENTWEDVKGRVFKAVPEVNEIKCVRDPSAAPTDEGVFRVEDFEGPVVEPPPPPAEQFEVFDHIARVFGEDRYILGFSGGCVGLSLPGGFETGLMLYALQPEVIAAMHRRQVVEQTMRDRHWIRPGTDGVLFDQDMAGTNAPYISPEMFRELSFPYMKRRVAAIKRHVPQMVMHNCGCNLPLIEQFIEAGFDGYQSLQTTAGMDIGMLKERYGDRMAFWGGVPLEVLIGGSIAETRQAVRRTLELAGHDGGIILGPSQSVARGTKYDNFMAMLEEATK